MSNGRATGKTFRAVLQALLLASEGKRVKFRSNCEGSQLSAIRLAKEISKGYAESFKSDTVIFPSGGLVLFTRGYGLLGNTFHEAIQDDKIV